MPETSEGHAAEQYLPENLRRLRELRGLSQAALGRAMSECGWPWHQQTVWKVENGRQPVGFGEATDLAGILGVGADRLTWTGPEANEEAAVLAAAGDLRVSWNEAAAALSRLHSARAGAESTLARSSESKYARVRDAARGLEGELAGLGLEDAIAEAAERWERDRGGDA